MSENDNLTEVAILKEKIRLTLETDAYKDDLIKTLQELLISKENLIAEMRERS